MKAPKYLIDIGPNGDDNYHAWIKHNAEIERIYGLLGNGTGSGIDFPEPEPGTYLKWDNDGNLINGTVDKCTCGDSAKSNVFDSVEDMKRSISTLSEGDNAETLGYYIPNDGGGAHYICKYIWSQAAYPWAIDLGLTDDIEYELEYKTDGTPKIDTITGEYVLKRDDNGNPIPVKDASGNIKKKHLYAMITDTTVNYRQFGAKLNGITDDEQSLILCHKYQHDNYTIEQASGRRRYYIKVENHEGIISKGSNEPLICSGDIDLSGSKIIVQDSNATWFGFYLWGDNEEDYMTYEPVKETTDTYVKDNFVVQTKGNGTGLYQNSVMFLKESPYAVRDDSGYLYSEPRYELLLHTTDGLLTSPLTYDWNNPGGLEINSPVSDYETHEVTTQTVNSHFNISYTRLPSTHYTFVGCDVELRTSANKYCSVLWVKCHNATVKGFNFYPDTDQMHNTVFKNTMIYIWGCYNVDVSDIVGFNAAGKKEDGANATSGYVIRATNCLQLRLHDISVQGYWGATAMNCVKDVHIERVNINRLDIHNYFYNLYIDQCNLFNHSIQIGEGRGIVQITNSNFYVNKLDADSYPNAHILEFNCTYGRIFEGKVLIENCNAYIKDPEDNEFDVCKIEFSPEAVSTLDTYKFPEVTIRNCNFTSYSEGTYLVYFMIAGTRNCKTSTKGPSAKIGYSRDLGNDMNGTLEWEYIGRGVDWIDDGNDSRLNVVEGQFIRTYKKFIDSDGKTIFYDYRYFLVTKAGKLPTPTESNVPNDYSGKEFTLGTATVKYASRNKWEASRSYNEGDCCFTEYSGWLPVYCYRCTKAGTSNGWRPTHLSGKVIEGENVYPSNLDACWWQYVGSASDFISKDFSSEMTVKENEVLYADHRLYRVVKGGKLNKVPPTQTPWLASFQEGTAILVFIGKDWASKTWWANGAYCLSYDNDNVLRCYQLVDQNGTTSGDIPVEGNGRCIDGDMIWQNTTKGSNKSWKAQTQFNVGDVISYNGNNYECVFDGRLELPHQTVIEDVSTNMTTGGDVFAFYEGGTDIPTKFNSRGKWVIKINNVETYRFRTFTNGYFCHKGNPQPTIIESPK